MEEMGLERNFTKNPHHKHCPTDKAAQRLHLGLPAEIHGRIPAAWHVVWLMEHFRVIPCCFLQAA